MALIQLELEELATFTRPSGASRYNPQGLLVWMDEDDPRFDHDDEGAALGLLIEPAAANIIPDSLTFQFLDDWYVQGMTYDLTSNVAPDGSNGTLLLSETTATSQHRIAWAPEEVIVDYSRPCTFSVYVKIIGDRALRLALTDYYTGEDTAECFYWPEDLEVAGPGTIEPVANGWYRVSITGMILNVDVCPYFQLTRDYGRTFAGDPSCSLEVWGPQLEQGEAMTSYIPTTTAQRSRAADQLFIPNGPWRSPVGTLEVDADPGVVAELETGGVRVTGHGHLRSLRFRPVI